MYQWEEYGHNPIAYERWEKEYSQNTSASWKTTKKIMQNHKETNAVSRIISILIICKQLENSMNTPPPPGPACFKMNIPIALVGCKQSHLRHNKIIVCTHKPNLLCNPWDIFWSENMQILNLIFLPPLDSFNRILSVVQPLFFQLMKDK